MALAAMQPRDDVSRTSAASLHTRTTSAPSITAATTSTPPQTPHVPTQPAPPPRLPPLAQLYRPDTAAGPATGRATGRALQLYQSETLQPPLPALGRAPPTPLSPATHRRSLPTLPLTSRTSLTSPRVIGDPLLRNIPPSSTSLYTATGGGGAGSSSYLPPPTGGQAGPSRRLSVPLGLRGEKRKSDLVPPPGSNIKDYCAVLTPFIYKLYCLVSDETTNELCCWSEDGLAFLVRDPTAFASSVLPNYFKHNQFSSFVRQLNKYRFHKLAPGAFLFGHERFVRGRPDLLREIGRQRSPDRAPVQTNPTVQSGVGGAGVLVQPVSPATKRARIRSDDSTNPNSNEGDFVRATVAVETAPLRGDVAALRRENAQLNARVQQLEDTVTSLRQHVEYLQTMIQSTQQTMGEPIFSYNNPHMNIGSARHLQRRSLPLPPPPHSQAQEHRRQQQTRPPGTE